MNNKFPTTWDLTPLFSSDNDPRIFEVREKAIGVTKEFCEKWKSREDFLLDPRILALALADYEHWKRYYGLNMTEWYYFFLRTSQDQNSPVLKAKMNQAQEIANQIRNEIQFFEQRIGKISVELQPKFLTHPELAQYRHFLERLFQMAKYMLSEAEEKIVNLKQQTAFDSWTQMLSGIIGKETREITLPDGKKITGNESQLIQYCSHEDESVRVAAWAALDSIYSRHADIAEAEMNAVLGYKKVEDELRGFDRPDISRHIGDDIDTTGVDALVSVVSDANALSSRFYRLKAQLLGQEKIQYYERQRQYGSLDGIYPYEDSADRVIRVLTELDEEFGTIAKKFIENGQMDVYPAITKRCGAFQAEGLPHEPIYIFLNHTDKFREVLTIAHECGHGINSTLFFRSQNALNCGVGMSVAEVASIFMEDFVVEDIAKNLDDEGHLAINIVRIGNYVQSIMRQIALYRFEQELHADFRVKGYLSKEEIGVLFSKHMRAYLGENVIWTPGSENGWMTWQHIRYFFYVYSYSSGALIAKALQTNIRKDRSYITKVKDFLSVGLSDSPKNAFAKLGIDITSRAFWEDGIQSIEELLDETEILAKKLGKI